MLKSKLVGILIVLMTLLSTSCEKEEPYVNSITFDGSTFYHVTSLYYNSDGDSNIVYFSRFMDGGTVNEENYIYCIVDDALLGRDVDITNCEEPFEWVVVVDGYNYFMNEESSVFFESGTFKVDVAGENFYTIEADFVTFDYKSVSIRWQGYFSYNVFNNK